MMQLALPYPPHGAGYKAAGTASEDAARAIAPRAPTLRQRALDVLAAHPAGLTADEVAHKLGESILTIRPRVSELHALGMVRSTERRHHNASGATATIWQAVSP